MRHLPAWMPVFLLIATAHEPAIGSDLPDSTAINRIQDEGLNRSQVMNILSWLTDVHGPRLTGSPEYAEAAEWARATMHSHGLSNARLERWGPFGRGWSLKRFSLQVLEPRAFPVIAYPKAWSSGTKGVVRGEAIVCDAETDSSLAAFRGKLKGRFVFVSRLQEVTPHFEPQATRESDKSLLELANAGTAPQRRQALQRRPDPERRARALVEYRKQMMCAEEGALAIVTASRGDGGNLFVQSSSIPQHPDSISRERRALRPYDNGAPPMPPQVTVSAEHYNRILRTVARGKTVVMEMDVSVRWTTSDSCMNVLADLPGSDLQDEVVLIGGHLDSWHAGTGTTDNAAGVAVAMEAARILAASGLKPRRTIRVGLWGGEEQGLLGSRAYVSRHLATRRGQGDTAAVRLTPDGEKFSVYFNMDNGTGRFRGIYLQGKEHARPLFRAWFEPFRSLGAATITSRSTGGTDHMAFESVGLPGFQFIQDEIEYESRTWHSSQDLYERAIAEDLKHNAVVMAAFAYQAAMQDERFPRKPITGR